MTNIYSRSISDLSKRELSQSLAQARHTHTTVTRFERENVNEQNKYI